MGSDSAKAGGLLAFIISVMLLIAGSTNVTDITQQDNSSLIIPSNSTLLPLNNNTKIDFNGDLKTENQYVGFAEDFLLYYDDGDPERWRWHKTKLEYWYSKGYKSIRLCFEFTTSPITPRGSRVHSVYNKAKMDTVLDILGEYGYRGIFVLQNVYTCKEYFGSQDWVDEWKQVATDYLDDDRVLGFNLAGEPTDSSSGYNTQATGGPLGSIDNRLELTQVVNYLIDEIRVIDPDRVIFHPTPCLLYNGAYSTWLADLSTAGTLSLDGIIYDVIHPYYWEDSTLDMGLTPVGKVADYMTNFVDNVIGTLGAENMWVGETYAAYRGSDSFLDRDASYTLQYTFLVTLINALTLRDVPFEIGWVTATYPIKQTCNYEAMEASNYLPSVPPRTSTSILSTELIDYSGLTSTDISSWVGLLVSQGISEFTLRIPSFSDWSDGLLSGTWEAISKSLITAADSAGISVNIDLHTWYTTWDNSFDDDAGAHAANRVTYLAYVADAVSSFSGTSVKAFMVLNEPQAQNATADENQFILDCISTAKANTSKPVSVRFMAGYSPSTGHYSAAIDTASDFFARNTYWDPRSPGTAVYGTTEAKMNTVIAAAVSAGKELWITEFGKSGGASAQWAYVAAFVDYIEEEEIDRGFVWASQYSGTSESYNIFDDTTPKAAFYELGTGEPFVPPDPDDPDIIIPPQVTLVLITFLNSTGGSIYPSVIAGTTVGFIAGTDVTVTAVPIEPLYAFSHWLLNGSNWGSENPKTWTLVEAWDNYTIQPVFTYTPPPTPTGADWTLTVFAGPGGTTSPTPASLDGLTDLSQEVTAIPSAGYRFSFWILDSTSTRITTNPYTVTSALGETHTLEPFFTLDVQGEQSEVMIIPTGTPVQVGDNTLANMRKQIDNVQNINLNDLRRRLS